MSRPATPGARPRRSHHSHNTYPRFSGTLAFFALALLLLSLVRGINAFSAPLAGALGAAAASPLGGAAANAPGAATSTSATSSMSSSAPGGAELGPCRTCVQMIELVKQGARNLDDLCSGMYRLHGPLTFGHCHHLVSAAHLHAENLLDWLTRGCYKYELYDSREWVTPCPSHVICSALLNLDDRPFCAALPPEDPFALPSPASSGPGAGTGAAAARPAAGSGLGTGAASNNAFGGLAGGGAGAAGRLF